MIKFLKEHISLKEKKVEVIVFLCLSILTMLASGEISHLLSGENDQSQSDRNNQCISFSFL